MEEMKDTFAQMKEEQHTETAAQTEETTEAKTEKRKTYAEALQEHKDKLKEIQAKIKELNSKNEKTEEEKTELKKLKATQSELKLEKAKLQKKVDNAKQNAIIRAEGKKLAERKQVAINKVLDAEGLNTENGVKGLIALRRVCMKYNVTGNKTLDSCLSYVKQNAPHLLSNG